MDKQLANYFFMEVSKIFTFLATEHNFASPQIKIDDDIDFAFVTFMGKNLAIEFILDERENDIACKVARIISGEKTSYYAVNKSGVRVRTALSNLIRQRGVREPLFTKVTGLDIREQIKITLADFAKMLIKHGQDILGDSPTALAEGKGERLS
jgi:hypothetical protein